MRTLLSALFLFALTLNLTTSANARVNNSIEGLWLNLSNVEELGVSCADYGDIYASINGMETKVFAKDHDSCRYVVLSNANLSTISNVALVAPSPASCNAIIENYTEKNFSLTFMSWNFDGDGAYCYFRLSR